MNTNLTDISAELVVPWVTMETAPWNRCGDRVRVLRERGGLSQQKLAEQVALIDSDAAVLQSQISNIEKNMSLPSTALLRALAIVLETNTDYLLGLTDDDRPPSDLEDQVVVTVEDSRDRAMVQEVADLLARATKEERAYTAELVRRILGPAHPRIIGR